MVQTFDAYRDIGRLGPIFEGPDKICIRAFYESSFDVHGRAGVANAGLVNPTEKPPGEDVANWVSYVFVVVFRLIKTVFPPEDTFPMNVSEGPSGVWLLEAPLWPVASLGLTAGPGWPGSMAMSRES